MHKTQWICLFPLSGSKAIEYNFHETWIRDDNFVYEKNHIDREVYLHRIDGAFDVCVCLYYQDR